MVVVVVVMNIYISATSIKMHLGIECNSLSKKKKVKEGEEAAHLKNLFLKEKYTSLFLF